MPTDESDTRQTYRSTELAPYKDEQILEELHVEDGHTQAEIAEFYNIDQSTVHYWLNKYGIDDEETGE